MKKRLMFRVIDRCEILEPMIGVSTSDLTPEELKNYLQILIQQLEENPNSLPHKLTVIKMWK